MNKYTLINEKNNNIFIWNYIAFLFLGISGISLNLIISFFYEPKTLGIFNQTIAIYIIFSMLGSGGINFSVLRSIASSKGKEIVEIIIGALIPNFFISLFSAFLLSYLAIPISKLLESPLLEKSIYCIVPGVFFLSINKVYLGIINGFNQIKKFSIFNIIRYLLILINLLLASFNYLEGYKISIIFSISELILFILLSFEIKNYFKPFCIKKIIKWIKIHTFFGLRSISSGMFIELNSKVDILLIGYFLSDSYVGIYSFAAFFTEGLYQLLATLQNIYNPIIAKMISKNSIKKLEFKINHDKIRIYFIFLIIAIIGLLLYYLFVNNLKILILYKSSFAVFSLLIIGLIFSSGYIPFINIFAMGNKPIWQNIFTGIYVILNIILNYLLIPLYKINGAALATSLATILSFLILKIFSKKLFGLKL